MFSRPRGGVERVILEDHGDIAIGWFHIVDDAPPNRDGAPADRLQSRDHAHRGRFAAPRGADNGQELAVRAIEGEIPHGLDRFPPLCVDLPDAV